MLSSSTNIAVLDKPAIRCIRKESEGDGSWKKASKKRPRLPIVASESWLVKDTLRRLSQGG